MGREQGSPGIAPKALGAGVSGRRRHMAQIVRALRIWNLVRTCALVCGLIISDD
jgi:hypothetical protein